MFVDKRKKIVELGAGGEGMKGDVDETNLGEGGEGGSRVSLKRDKEERSGKSPPAKPNNAFVNVRRSSGCYRNVTPLEKFGEIAT